MAYPPLDPITCKAAERRSRKAKISELKKAISKLERGPLAYWNRQAKNRRTKIGRRRAKERAGKYESLLKYMQRQLVAKEKSALTKKRHRDVLTAIRALEDAREEGLSKKTSRARGKLNGMLMLPGVSDTDRELIRDTLERDDLDNPTQRVQQTVSNTAGMLTMARLNQPASSTKSGTAPGEEEMDETQIAAEDMEPAGIMDTLWPTHKPIYARPVVWIAAAAVIGGGALYATREK